MGVGLIGASFGLAMKKYGLCGRITGYSRNLENLKRAKEKAIIDSFESDPVEACKESDLLLLSTPIGSFIDIVGKIRNSLKRGSIVTDVGSVKGRLVQDLDALMPEGIYFVGGHPIAGSNYSGIDRASADIFRGAKCIITPTEKTDKTALEKIIALWESFGSLVNLVNPGEHDKIYALVSHLPHLIAYELVNTVADVNSLYFKYSGQGFLDTTRIASSSPEIWRDICILNRENIIESLEVFRNNLERVSQYLRANDAESLKKDILRARTLREGIGQR
jgi:prephenate dehydrogenase